MDLSSRLIGMCMCVFCKCVSLRCEAKQLTLSWPFCPACTGGLSWLLYIARGAAGVVFVRLGGVVHLPNDLGEQFVYHGFALGRGLHERAAPLLGQGLTLIGRYLPLALQVHLVPHQDHRDLLVPEDRHRRTCEKAAADELLGGISQLLWIHASHVFSSLC